MLPRFYHFKMSLRLGLCRLPLLRWAITPLSNRALDAVGVMESDNAGSPVIGKSRNWKSPLLQTARRLRRFKASSDLGDEQIAQVERDIFIGFYSVRKLFDAPGKITDKTRGLFLSISKHPNLKPVSWRNYHKLDELYDLTTSGNESRDVRFVCGRIVHSFVFAPCMSEEGGLHGVFFNSDHDKDKCLYFISIDEVISLFAQVGNDDPRSIKWSRIPRQGLRH